MNLELVEIIMKVAKEFGYEDAALAAFIETETGGKGFDKTTGKIIIQFEPLGI